MELLDHPHVYMCSEPTGTHSCFHTQNRSLPDFPTSGPYPGMPPEPSSSSFMCYFQVGLLDLFPRSRLGPKGTGLLCTQPWMGSAAAKHMRHPLPSRRSRHMQKTGSQTSTTQWDPGGKHEDKGVPTMCQDQPRGIRKTSSRR